MADTSAFEVDASGLVPTTTRPVGCDRNQTTRIRFGRCIVYTSLC